MNGSPHRGQDLAGVAALLADSTRAAFCTALLDSRAWTASELARHAGVAPSTATEHLHRLVAGGLLVEQRQGRHRYVRLAGPHVAQLIEDLTGFAAPETPSPRSMVASARRRALERARTCYDHLAGSLGVAIADAMVHRGLVNHEPGLALTPAGHDWLRAAGIDIVNGTRRPLVRPCLDWTERRTHLAGAVGAAICRHALDAGWVVPTRTSRAVTVTPRGADFLRTHLGVDDTWSS